MYSHLEGKIIDFVDNRGDINKARVVGCDKDIGITIVDAEDKGKCIYCLQGPSSPNWSKSNDPLNKDQCGKIFERVVKMIETGVLSYSGIIASSTEIAPESQVGYTPGAEMCPFL